MTQSGHSSNAGARLTNQAFFSSWRSAVERSLLVCLVCVALALPAVPNSARAPLPVEITATHPLEPLSALEMKAAHEIVTDRFQRDHAAPDDKPPFTMLLS